MELELLRTYNPEGTNGKILLKGSLILYSIELPWKNNQTRVSCIPEGKYELEKRWSPKFLRHLQVMHVKDREYILIHPANDALHELKGCIAPVSFLTGPGKGNGSRVALKKLTALVYAAFGQSKSVFLTIKEEVHVYNG
jgi:hypothetical protein